MAENINSKFRISNNTLLGNHLTSIESISPGETVFIESPLFIGPRNTFPENVSVCLSCCQKTENICTKCKWSICSKECEENHWHSKFECKIFKKRKIPLFVGPYLWVSILRCLLTQKVEPEIWEKIKKFESHKDARKKLFFMVEQRNQAYEAILNGFKYSEFTLEDIDFVFGVLIVNGYGDSSRYSIKLYELASKISHSCIPNTRSVLIDASDSSHSQKLKIHSILRIHADQILTQLYSNLVTGTYKRQQIIQQTYFFSCQCLRCKDPTELQTHFSTVKCQNGTCDNALVLPEQPTNLNSLWKCQNCRSVWNYEYIHANILEKIEYETGIGIYDVFYNNFEAYSSESPEKALQGNEAVSIKIDYILDLLQKIQIITKCYVHPNHYGLLPHKTSIISTIHEILGTPAECLTQDVKKMILDIENKLCQELLEIFDVILPGFTRDRGIILFFFGVNLYRQEVSSYKSSLESKSLETLNKAKEILNLEPDSDPFKQSITKFCLDHDILLSC